MVERSVERIFHVESINVIKTMKLEKAARPSGVNDQMIDASGQVGEELIRKLCSKSVGWKRYVR